MLVWTFKRRAVFRLLLDPDSGLVMLISLSLAAPHISCQASVKGSLSTLHLAVVQIEPELPVGGSWKEVHLEGYSVHT